MISGGHKGAALLYIYIRFWGLQRDSVSLFMKILYYELNMHNFTPFLVSNFKEYVISGGCKGQPFFS